MVSKRRRAIRGLIVFILAMAILAFFSRTFYYAILPKVEVVSVSGGVLQTLISGGDFLLDSDQVERVEVSADLADYGLHIERVWIRRCDAVQEGDPLIQFDSAQGANVLKRAQRARQRAEEALLTWDKGFLDAQEQVNEEMIELRKTMLKEDADPEALSRQLKMLEEEIAYMKRTQMVSGVSRESLEQALSDLIIITDELTELAEQNWMLPSKTDGIVLDVMAVSGDEYDGLLPLADLAPSTAQILVGIECESDVDIDDPDGVFVYGGDDLPSNGESNWRFAGETSSRGERILWAESVEAAPDLSCLTKLNFRIESEYMQYLVPNNAVIGGSYVYVLDRRLGAWGTEELFARQVEVRGIRSDSTNTYIPSGLMDTDRVIIRWDRPFQDGDTVILPLE